MFDCHRQWGEIIKEAVIRKRDEFGCVSISSLSLSSTNLADRRNYLAPIAVTSQRMYRSRSHGNLIDNSEKTDESQDDIDYKHCLIQQDEEEQERLNMNNFEFQRRMVNNRADQFRRYS